MNKLIKLCQCLFAVAIIGFGILQLINGNFISSIPSYAKSSILYVGWAYILGILLIVTGVLLLAGQKIKLLLMADALIIFASEFLSRLVILCTHFNFGGEITLTGKALALTGSLMVVAASMQFKPTNLTDKFANYNNLDTVLTTTGLYFIGIFMVICGIQHFLFMVFVKTLVPQWIPGAEFWTYFAGVALIAGGLGLFIKQTRLVAASLLGLMIFLWMIMLHFPRVLANVHDNNEMVSLMETIAFSAALFVLPAKVYQQKSVFKNTLQVI